MAPDVAPGALVFRNTLTMINRLLAGAFAALLSVAVAAAIDTSGIDSLLMQDMDASAKDLEPLIGARNAPVATKAVTVLRKGLKWTEDYFAAQGADDAAQLARDGQQNASAVLSALSGGDFAGAATAARALTKTCRACHDIYRP